MILRSLVIGVVVGLVAVPLLAGDTPAAANAGTASTGTAGPCSGNTVTFDHLGGIVQSPAPAKLCLSDGEAFVVEFVHTDPTRFRYSISVVEDSPIKSGGQLLQSGEAKSRADKTVRLTWQHDAAFSLYKVSVLAGVEPTAKPTATDAAKRVEASAKAIADQPGNEVKSGELKALGRDMRVLMNEVRALPGTATRLEEIEDKRAELENALRTQQPSPEAVERETHAIAEGASTVATMIEDATPATLYSYSFPIWVETIGWAPSFTGGFVFSGLTSTDYFLKTHGKDTPNDPADDKVTVEESGRHGDAFKPDVIALASFTYLRPGANDWGFSLGVGLDDQADQRYYLGGHYAIGRYLRVALGAAGGTVDVLKPGWNTGQAPLDAAATSVPLEGKFRVSWFVGFGFSIAPRESEFKGTLAVTQQSGADK